jgi:trk system potassium uptake protein TrkA
VEEAVSVGTIVRLLKFEHGDAGLVEVTLADDSPAKGTAISELEIPRDATVVAVVRSDHVIVPRGDTVVQAGDEVLCLVTGTGEQAIKQIFIAAG